MSWPIFPGLVITIPHPEHSLGFSGPTQFFLSYHRKLKAPFY